MLTMSLGKKIDSWYFIDWNTGEKHSYMNFDKQGELCTAIASKSILLSKSGTVFIFKFIKPNNINLDCCIVYFFKHTTI